MFQTRHISDNDNPVIDGTGVVTFPADHYCTWKTNNGSTCICNITNSSMSNTLTVIVSGAPNTMMTTTGVAFNGRHSLPPNTPTASVTAFGDFQGRQVSIVNISTPSADAKVMAQCPMVSGIEPGTGELDPSTVAEFVQIASTQIYETQGSDNIGWAGYLLPTATGLPSTIPLTNSLASHDGHYLFSVLRPAQLDADPEGFAQAVLSYIQAQTANQATLRAMLWLPEGASVDGLEFGRFALSFAFDRFDNKYVVQGSLTARLGANASFRILEGTALRIDETEPAMRFQSPTDVMPQQLAFANADGTDMGIRLFASTGFIRLWLPFVGPHTGCAGFNAELKPAQTFVEHGFLQGFLFAAGKGEALGYSAYTVASLPEIMDLACSVDPSDMLNLASPALLEQGVLRTGFGFLGDPTLESGYRTAGGRTLSLVPLGTEAGVRAPPAGIGGLAWASDAEIDPDTAGGTAYLTLVGPHGMVVEGRPPGCSELLLAGLSGSETLTFVSWDPSAETNDLLYVLPSEGGGVAPKFPFEDASLDSPESGAVGALLRREVRCAWTTIQAGVGPVVYSTEPAGSPLFGLGSTDAAAALDEVSVLESRPPTFVLPQGLDKTFPMVPYGATAGIDSRRLQFESQVLSVVRKSTISSDSAELWAARAAAVDPEVEYGTTPQGFVIQRDPATGGYLNVLMAQSGRKPDQKLNCSTPPQQPTYLPFSFSKPTQPLEDALQTNQLFLVVVNPEPLTTDGACFENVVNMSGWTMTADVGKGATATSYANVLILKFCSGSLQERITNPNRWTRPTDFSLLPGTDPELAGLSTTGLSQWLQAYVAEGVERSEGPSAAFYREFARIATDPEWNGVIALAVDLGIESLPKEIVGLAAGIDFTRFAAHHFGFTVSRVEVDKSSGVISIADGDSSLFGLVDYEDPIYASNLSSGVDPDMPISIQFEGDFDFTVLQLQSLFENAKLVRFNSRIQLSIDRLFAADVSEVFSAGRLQPANGIVLDGSYVDQNGEPTYVFQQTTKNVLHSDSNILPAVAFDRVQFNTLGERDGGATVANRFLIWGAFDFAELNDRDGALLDVLSFGSPEGTATAELGVGLAFSNLVIEMTFPTVTPSAKRFEVDTDNQAWDLGASEQRDDSLFRGFALQLKSFVTAAGDQTPADLGFLAVTSGLELTELEGPWFGVVYEITLGGPGALASTVGFQSQLLVAWAPNTKGDGPRALFLGMSLPGAAPGAKLFSLQGVFKVAVGAISILRQVVPTTEGRELDAEEFYYCLRIDDIGLKIFGIVKLPPSANIQFFLFGDPNATGSLGWYAAYVADDNPGCNQSLALAPFNESQETCP